MKLCSGTVLHLCYFVVVQERVASSEIVSTWVDDGRCPYINEVKTIVHPGEVRAAVTPLDAALWGLWAAINGCCLHCHLSVNSMSACKFLVVCVGCRGSYVASTAYVFPYSCC